VLKLDVGRDGAPCMAADS